MVDWQSAAQASALENCVSQINARFSVQHKKRQSGAFNQCTRRRMIALLYGISRNPNDRLAPLPARSLVTCKDETGRSENSSPNGLFLQKQRNLSPTTPWNAGQSQVQVDASIRSTDTRKRTRSNSHKEQQTAPKYPSNMNLKNLV